MNAGWKSLLRPCAPWLLAGAGAWWLVAHAIPSAWCETLALREETARLEHIAPRPEVLAERVREAVRDSAERGRMLGLARTRLAGGSDPSSQVATLIVPVLERSGVGLKRVAAREHEGEVLLSLSTSTSWAPLLQGVAELDSLPISWTIRRLSVRPSEGARLGGEIVLGVPVAPEGLR